MIASALLLLVVVGTTAFVAALLVAFVRRCASRRLLDLPNDRSSHERPTPRGGGLGIVTVVAVGYFVLVGAHWPVVVGLGAILLAGVSFLDDLHRMPPGWRLLAQIVVGGALVGIVPAWQNVELPFAGGILPGLLGSVLALIWVVGLSNAYNFMDGIDAMAGIQAVVAGGAWVVLGGIVGEPELSMVGSLVAGAALGFLWHNWPPASIFMGDVGSVFLGYAFAALAIVGAIRAPRLAVAGILVVWPFVFDTAFTLLRRLRRRENVMIAHRSHLYQRLTMAGWSHQSVSLCYGVLALAAVVLACEYAAGNHMGSASFVLAVLALSCALLLLVHWAERGRHLRTGVSGTARQGGDA